MLCTPHAAVAFVLERAVGGCRCVLQGAAEAAMDPERPASTDSLRGKTLGEMIRDPGADPSVVKELSESTDALGYTGAMSSRQQVYMRIPAVHSCSNPWSSPCGEWSRSGRHRGAAALWTPH